MKTSLATLRRIFSGRSPQSILYEVTTRCNLCCPHCYNVWKDDVGYCEDELPTKRSLQLVERAIRESRCRQFVFTGGGAYAS